MNESVMFSEAMRITSERAEDLDEAFCLRRPSVLMGFPDLKLTPAGQPGKLVTQCSQWTYTASLLGFHAHISFHSWLKPWNRSTSSLDVHDV
ncbi:hypothetical protein AMECASPLE_037934 [Ameca splendens]|uniref:Uncharacterized protein n=1 Tax=Ameca splendens TaxID=208324 RepID=A0ABV1AFY0_9TELE